MSQVNDILGSVADAIERDDLPAAKSAALAAHDVATTKSDKARAAYAVAETLNRLGEWVDATSWWTRTIEAKNALTFETAFSTLKSGITQFNAGLAYRMTGAHGPSLDAYEKAMASFVAIGHREYTLTALLNLAWVDCLASETKRAPLYLAMAQGLVDTQEQRYQLVLGEAFCASRTGDESVAVDLCRRLVDDAEAPAFVKAQAAWVSASVYEDGDDYANAQRLLALAEDFAKTLPAAQRNHVAVDIERIKRRIAKAG